MKCCSYYHHAHLELIDGSNRPDPDYISVEPLTQLQVYVKGHPLNSANL